MGDVAVSIGVQELERILHVVFAHLWSKGQGSGRDQGTARSRAGASGRNLEPHPIESTHLSPEMDFTNKVLLK